MVTELYIYPKNPHQYQQQKVEYLLLKIISTVWFIGLIHHLDQFQTIDILNNTPVSTALQIFGLIGMDRQGILILNITHLLEPVFGLWIAQVI